MHGLLLLPALLCDHPRMHACMHACALHCKVTHTHSVGACPHHTTPHLHRTACLQLPTTQKFMINHLGWRMTMKQPMNVSHTRVGDWWPGPSLPPSLPQSSVPHCRYYRAVLCFAVLQNPPKTPDGVVNPLLLFDYRCHVPGGECACASCRLLATMVLEQEVDTPQAQHHGRHAHRGRCGRHIRTALVRVHMRSHARCV